MAQASLSTGLARTHLVPVLYRDIPFMAQASLSVVSRPHLLLNIIAAGARLLQFKLLFVAVLYLFIE